MYVYDRPFDEARNDFEKMWRFVQQDYAHKQDQFVWLFSRLGDWKYGLWDQKKYVPSFFREYAHLWLDAFDRLLGFVLSEDGGNIFFIFTLQGYDYLYAEILDWTTQHWGPRYETLVTEVHEFQTEALARLEECGFISNGVAATTRAYDLLNRPDEIISLPPGYRIVDMSENSDVHSKALLYLDAYEGKSEINELFLLLSAYSHENPAYEPCFDLSVITAEGQHVAACVGFNDPAYGVAEVEKVCTHSQYRRQGLAEAVIRACFQRLKQRGIARAYITGYSGEANSLYERLAPVHHKRWYHYELKGAV